MLLKHSVLPCAFLLCTGIAQCGTILFFGTLTGPNESPANASPGIGNAVVTWDTSAQTLEVAVTFSGLLGNTTASHIHCCVDPNGTAGVATAVPTFPGFPLGVTSGSYDRIFDLTADATYNPAFVTAHGGTAAGAEAALTAGLQEGRAYLNIHSTIFPGGEIRDFLTTPEPSSAVLAATSLLALWLRRRLAP